MRHLHLRRRPDACDAELAALADGSLGPDRMAALEARVAESAELGARLGQQQHAVALARGGAARVEAPAMLRSRIEAQRRSRHDAKRHRSARRLALAGAATAALAVAVGVDVVGSRTSAEHYSATLAPTGLAPGARGEATLTRTPSGWRIRLDATGLPRLTGGLYYEAWLRSAAGALVPVGTFNEARHVMLWAGVSPEHHGVLSITRELADGDQASSGVQVLAGTVDTGD